MATLNLPNNTIKFLSPLESYNNYKAFVQLEMLFRELILSASIKEIIVIETKAAIFVDCNKIEVPNRETITIIFDDIIEINTLKIKNISIFFETRSFEDLYINQTS